MCGEPVEMFRCVMDGVEAPEEGIGVLEAVGPVDEKIAQDDDFDELKGPGLAGDGVAEESGDDGVQVLREVNEDGENQGVEEQVLAQEEPEISEPVRTKKTLARLCGEGFFKGYENDDQEDEAGGDGKDGEEEGHGLFGCGLGGRRFNGGFVGGGRKVFFCGFKHRCGLGAGKKPRISRLCRGGLDVGRLNDRFGFGAAQQCRGSG